MFYLLIFAFLVIILVIYLNLKKSTETVQQTEEKTESSVKEVIQKELKTQKTVTRKRALPYRSSEPFVEAQNISVESFKIFEGAKLLFVEDNVINQKILVSTLKKSGIEITVANNGEEALELLFEKEKEFDMVLMDISMPVMDGYTATQKIREDKRFEYLPIVTFTAFTQGPEIHKMFDLGANGHITKPLNIGQLYTVFMTYLPAVKRKLSLIEELKIDGLDVKHGIIMANGNIHAYKQSLLEFSHTYESMVETMPVWIDNNESQHILAMCSKMSKILNHIGAYELEAIVFRMKKIYIYKTEHRIEEFRELFPQKLQVLLNTIDRYLKEG